MQITFGKKISFRPLVISLIWFLVIGGVFFDLLGSWSWLVGLIIFFMDFWHPLHWGHRIRI